MESDRAEIYRQLVELAALTEEHRRELRKKRGFKDKTIDTFRFRSGGQHLLPVLEQIREKFSTEALIKSGVFRQAGNALAPCEMLLEDRILIPYLDEAQRVYHLRPHKLGFEDVPIEIFCQFLVAEKPGEVVLTEGEFKAVALYQWGIAALAIPGVSSFAGKYFTRLTDLLKWAEVRKVYVIFDNEIKDNPAFPNYKEKPEDRYDTPFWAYVMAVKLRKEGFETVIGILPDEWRVNGKIDFDGALAQGRTKAEILKVLADALTPQEYLDGFTGEARKILGRKLTSYFSDIPLRREHNRYVIRREREKGAYDDVISNFVLNIKSSFYTGDGCYRNVQLVNEYGETSETFVLEPASMAGLTEFKKFCFSKGNYIFDGKSSDLNMIWKFEFLRDTGDLIYMPEQIGRIRDDLWLFGNLAIKKGKIYRPDTDGIIWIEGRGYKPQSLQIGPHGETMEEAIPSLSERHLDIVEVAEKLKASVGGYEAYMGLGWVVATIFSQDIFNRYKCFPFLFPHGKRESGKSTFMRWLMAFFGVETEGTGIAESTQNYIMRALSYYSSLGVWFDEYRNEARITQKDGYLRSAYNRQLSGKGIREAFGSRSYRVRGTLAISGEELPKDNGLFTRCVPIQISAYRRSRGPKDWLDMRASRFSGFTYELILNYDKLLPKVLANIHELREALIKLEITDRTAENWAILAGAFEAAVLQDDEFIRWVHESCQSVKRIGEQEHLLSVFWDDVNYLVSEGTFGEKYLRQHDNYLYLWFEGVYDAWAIHYRQRTGKEPFDRQSVRKYLQDEPYYVESNIRLMGTTKRRVHIIDLRQASETIKEIAASLTPAHEPAPLEQEAEK